MLDDHDLLRQYAAAHSEESFAELVHRHLDLVYSAALRQTNGNVHLSREIAQSVFTDLAQRAGSLNRSTVLVGWLHTAVRFAASKAIRSAARRERHERAAAEMNETLHTPDTPLDSTRLQPVIDAAIGDLKPREREAVLMRFFERREFDDLGTRLALSESAARSCVDRALKKMRATLERRGVKSTTTALAVALGEQIVAAAPAGLAASVAANSIASAAATSVTAAFLFLTMTKLQYALVGALAIGSGLSIALSIKLADRERELAALRPQITLFTETKQENFTLRKRLTDAEAALAAALNQPVTSEKTSTPPLAVTSSSSTTSDIEKELIKVEDCRNVGSSTAAAAFQTMIWAALTGDDDTLASLVFLEPESIKRGAEYLQQLPEDTRRKFKSPQHVVALFLADEVVRNSSKIQIIETKPTADDSRVALFIRRTTKRYEVPAEAAQEFVKVGEQWRFPVNQKLVEQLFERLRKKAPASP